MRPTMLMFRSPKEHTPEFYVPIMLNDGNYISFRQLKNSKTNTKNARINSSFSKQRRFIEYKLLAKITSK